MQLAMALSMFAGQNIGAGEEQRAKDGIKATMFMQLIYAGAMFFILPAIAPALIKLFGLADDAAVMGLATMGLSFMARMVWMFGMFQALIVGRLPNLTLLTIILAVSVFTSRPA